MIRQFVYYHETERKAGERFGISPIARHGEPTLVHPTDPVRLSRAIQQSTNANNFKLLFNVITNLVYLLTEGFEVFRCPCH